MIIEQTRDKFRLELDAHEMQMMQAMFLLLNCFYRSQAIGGSGKDYVHTTNLQLQSVGVEVTSRNLPVQKIGAEEMQ